MIVSNPIVRGFYPDPSVCKVDEMYYMVCSSFQFFPGVPLFESKDLIHWKQIGHVLTRNSQVSLGHVESSGGVFAPTIRYDNGRFYMTTTNNTTQQNFYVWTEDIYGPWSEPIYVDQNGIDPSFYFENGRAFFMSNGSDDDGVPGIVQCEIEIETGRKLSKSKTIWQGSGGRFLESPHLYYIDGMYYLMAAEGGTEYGHMITYAKSDNLWGPFHSYPHNPVLTNRNLGGFDIQGIGHGDLIEGPDGNYFILHLGFRQIGKWSAFHHLGREVFIAPVTMRENGWFTSGKDGTTAGEFEIKHLTEPQILKDEYTFENTDWDLDWCYLRVPMEEKYIRNVDSVELIGTDLTLSDPLSPTCVFLRQKEFSAEISCRLNGLEKGEAGITIYMDENHHYDFGVQEIEQGYRIFVRLCIGNIKHIAGYVDVDKLAEVKLLIKSDAVTYHFYVYENGEELELAQGLTRYLSTEVAGGFTGVLIGLYAQCDTEENYVKFTDFSCKYIK